MIYRQIAFFLLAVFYGLFFWKLWKDKGTKTARQTEISNKMQKYFSLHIMVWYAWKWSVSLWVMRCLDIPAEAS